MNRFPLFCLLATAFAGVHAETFIDNARVRSVDPQYENVSVPREVCSKQWVTEQQQPGFGHQYGGAVIGGVAGAVVGNQVGKGHGREAATALGAVVGAFAGDRVANGGRQPESFQREVTSCQTVNEVQNRIAGYRVHYEYRGQSYTTMLRENPGQNLQVRVSVDPVVR
jgi:uncharacterized protein YcfJ